MGLHHIFQHTKHGLFPLVYQKSLFLGLLMQSVYVLSSRTAPDSPITVHETLSVVLPCTVYPNGGTVTWYKGSELITRDRDVLRYRNNILFTPGIRYDEWNIEILHADPSYADIYFCKVDGVTITKIQVIVRPAYSRFGHGSQSYRVKESVNPKTTLLCDVSGYPTANITWSTKSGEDVRSFRQLSMTKQRITNFNNMTRFTDDNYKCEVTNGTGVHGNDVSLAVKLVTWCIDQNDRWDIWWGYDLMSGPSEWAVSNSDWSICKTGKNQSPINIEPQTLLYDPHLKPVHIEGATVNGLLKNTGKDVTLYIYDDQGTFINITSGPLSYTYRLYQIKLHFGRYNSVGSEHTVNGTSFPGEIHFIAYNVDIYANYSIASASPRGLAIIGVFISVGNSENSAFRLLSERFTHIKTLHTCVEVFDLPIDKLLPQTDHYMTYSGSLTQPSCKETVTWILYNKPIYISQAQMSALRTIPYQEWTGGSNTRPVMPLNHRTVRTNINIHKKSRLCTMEVSKTYQVNPNIGQ